MSAQELLANLRGEIHRAPEFLSRFRSRAAWIEASRDALLCFEDTGQLEKQDAQWRSS